MNKINFKIGDKVKAKGIDDFNNSDYVGKIVDIEENEMYGLNYLLDNNEYYNKNQLELLEE